jgi:hypothetical protein
MPWSLGDDDPIHGSRFGRPRVHVERRLEDYPAPTPQPTPCRLWQGAVDADGYGTLIANHLKRNKMRAHRWVWEMANGPIKPGLVVRHKCDNRLCFRLSHLELGTVADNNRDASERGHLGPQGILKPSHVRIIRRLRDEGRSWRQVRDALIATLGPNDHIPSEQTVRRIGPMLAKGLFDDDGQRIYPEQPPDPYSSWRNRERATDPVRRRPGDTAEGSPAPA